ncbi:hypothetical protein WAI453_004487 [Rhynchosporium graminicola]
MADGSAANSDDKDGDDGDDGDEGDDDEDSVDVQDSHSSFIALGVSTDVQVSLGLAKENTEEYLPEYPLR